MGDAEINCERTIPAVLKSIAGVNTQKDALIQRRVWRAISGSSTAGEMSLGLSCPISTTTVISKISTCPRRVSLIDGGLEHRMEGCRYLLEGS